MRREKKPGSDVYDGVGTVKTDVQRGEGWIGNQLLPEKREKIRVPPGDTKKAVRWRWRRKKQRGPDRSRILRENERKPEEGSEKKKALANLRGGASWTGWQRETCRKGSP